MPIHENKDVNEVVMALFKVLSGSFPLGYEESHDMFQPE
jgi:hypothetical protein